MAPTLNPAVRKVHFESQIKHFPYFPITYPIDQLIYQNGCFNQKSLSILNSILFVWNLTTDLKSIDLLLIRLSETDNFQVCKCYFINLTAYNPADHLKQITKPSLDLLELD